MPVGAEFFFTQAFHGALDEVLILKTTAGKDNLFLPDRAHDRDERLDEHIVEFRRNGSELGPALEVIE